MKKVFFIVLAVVFFGACAKEQILVSTYSAPKEAKKIQSLSQKGKDSAFTMAINPKVAFSQKSSRQGVMTTYLTGDLKELITQTGFIGIHPIFEDAPITTNMNVVSLNAKKEGNSVKANLSVKFSILKNASVKFTKIYSEDDYRSSKSAQTLPSIDTVLADLSKRVVKKFVKDISPLKRKKLVSIKSLPSDIKYASDYAKSGNFESAVSAMEKYKGKKNYEFYYDLAVFYEGLAAKKEDFSILENANDAYDKSFAMGGSKDEEILKQKGRFDKFYRLFSSIQEQKSKNKKASDSLEEEYEILE